MIRKKTTYVIIVLAVVLPLVFKPYRDFWYRISADFFYPFFSFPAQVKDSMGKKVYLSKSKRELVSQLFKMKKTITELEAKCKYLQNFEDENKELRQLLDIRAIPNFKYIIAEIMYRDPVRWYNQFTINKGSDAGVENGAIVLGSIMNSVKEKTQFGVIGRIGAVSKHTAVVYTILSNECQLSVKVPSNGATGILHGGERRGQKTWSNVLFLPKDLEYKEESMVITSGLTPLAPKGLMIGKLINNINNVPNDDKLFARALVEPAIDLAHLDFILVLGKDND